MKEPQCPKCNSEYTYADGSLWVCPSCSYEWSQSQTSDSKNNNDENHEESSVIKDAHGNVLADGDSVTVIKELRIKGSSSVVKVGTKVKNIRHRW